jgi:large subunit ribosomal protein L7/L12
MRDAGLMATLKTAQETSQEVQKLVAKGRKVEAIKILREKSGLGLKEAKDLVDRLG